MNKNFLITFFFFMFFFKSSATENYKKVFYDFQIQSITGETINFKDYENKGVLIVNTASFCGFTKQYDDLQLLWEKYKLNDFIILGIPSNSFNQERSNDNEVKEFCEVNFSITFPMSTITDVKGKNAHDIFKWAEKNYGNSAIPKWNFHKILINKEGKIQATYNSFTKPTSKKITSEIDKILKINS